MIKRIAKIMSAQDGAIYKNFLFRFTSKGSCRVYDLEAIPEGYDGEEELLPFGRFRLDRADEFVPHSNSVTFGNRFYAEGDEFPLLYSNIYNNYKKEENRHLGVCCVYRIEREGNEFRSTFVQIIEVGFTDDTSLWRSSDGTEDVRPYGNFVADADRGLLYAFVMRDGDKSTRYFALDLPAPTEGDSSEFGIKKVILRPSDIKEYFDTPYHRYLQGATCHKGKIYSVEGFGEKNHPALRIIATERREQIFFLDFFEEGVCREAEFIDFYGEKCYYSDADGNLFELEL